MSTIIESAFGIPKVLLPVMKGPSFMDSVEASVDAGCRGVFFTNQEISNEDLGRLILGVRTRHPTLWIGVNFLGFTPAAALAIGESLRIYPDGLWSDQSGVVSAEGEQTYASEFRTAVERRGWTGLYFGGVSFKYQRQVEPENLASVTETACQYMDVVCTSGPGTGLAADVEKIKRMHEGLVPGASLALASGVDSTNVESFLPYVDAFLVGTSLRDIRGPLKREKVERLRLQIEERQPRLRWEFKPGGS